MSNRERDPMEYDYGPEAFPPIQPPPAQPPGVHCPQEPYPPPPVPRRRVWQPFTSLRWPSDEFWISMVAFVGLSGVLVVAIRTVAEEWEQMYGPGTMETSVLQVSTWLMLLFGILALATVCFRRNQNGK
ncbi:MAG: hypothetical protein ACLFVU_09520 [Phycisphaerae bacterium]